MNNWGIEPDDWFKRIFGSSNFPSSREELVAETGSEICLDSLNK